MKTKWLIPLFLVCIVLAAAACAVLGEELIGSLESIDSQPANSVESGTLRQQAESSQAVPSAVPAPMAPEYFDVVQISDETADIGVDFGEHKLSEEQSAAITALVQNVVTGYREGWLPLPVREASEYRLNSPLPPGVALPESVEAQDFTLTAEGTEMWGGLKAILPLNNGYSLRVHVVQKDSDQLGMIIFIVDAGFVQESRTATDAQTSAA